MSVVLCSPYIVSKRLCFGVATGGSSTFCVFTVLALFN